jgi:hypothetical protein
LSIRIWARQPRAGSPSRRTHAFAPTPRPTTFGFEVSVDAARRAASIGLFLSEADGEGALARRETADRSLSHTRH